MPSRKTEKKILENILQSNIVEFLSILQAIFTQEPPVYSKPTETPPIAMPPATALPSMGSTASRPHIQAYPGTNFYTSNTMNPSQYSSSTASITTSTPSSSSSPSVTSAADTISGPKQASLSKFSYPGPPPVPMKIPAIIPPTSTAVYPPPPSSSVSSTHSITPPPQPTPQVNVGNLNHDHPQIRPPSSLTAGYPIPNQIPNQNNKQLAPISAAVSSVANPSSINFNSNQFQSGSTPYLRNSYTINNNTIPNINNVNPNPNIPLPSSISPITSSQSSSAAEDESQLKLFQLKIAVQDKVNNSMRDLQTQIGHEMENLLNINRLLNEGDARITDYLNRLREEQVTSRTYLN